MKELVKSNKSHNIKNAKKMVERLDPLVWDILEDVIKETPGYVKPCPYPAPFGNSGL